MDTTNQFLKSCLILGLVLAVSGCISQRRMTRNTRPAKFPQLTGGNLADNGVDSVSAVDSVQLASKTDFDVIDFADIASAAPRSSETELPSDFRDITLDEAIHIALLNTETMRSLGASILRSPQASVGQYGPAIQSTDPNRGIEAALAQFDTRLNSSLTHAKNDNVFNNSVIGGGATEVRDDVSSGNFGLAKTTAAGTQFFLNKSFQHSQSNNPNLLFPHSWTTTLEAVARQPLLQGRGTRFNRIAGPNGIVGLAGRPGVVISQINHDISIAQFEREIREMVEEVITAYWQLDLAYNNFEAIRGSRDISLSTWNIAKARFESEIEGGEADREAQAREQYFEFEAQLLTALNGDDQSGQNGVYSAEADLRRLLDLPQSGNQLLRPVDETAVVKMVFDWPSLVEGTLKRRVELREQTWRVKRRQLELEASRNFLLPRLDAVATYRNNGFGDDLIGGGQRFSSAISDALSNDHGEWEIGLTYDYTVGFRQAHAGVRNAELFLNREKAILKEQQKQVLHDLGSAIRQLDQAYGVAKINRSRFEAANITVKARQAAFESDNVGFEELLDSQRRLLQAELAYQRTVANFERAKERLHSESGSLAQEHGIEIQEECKY